MSVHRPPTSQYYHYDFRVRGRRFRGSTDQALREDAERVEAQLKLNARRRARGILLPEDVPSPRIQDWVEHYYEEVAPRLVRPAAKAHLIRTALRFWGERPTQSGKVHTHGVYHDLTLRDVVDDPHWTTRWEAWLRACGFSSQSKNHLRGLVADWYRVALSPAWRQRTGVEMNPFAGQWRDPVVGRTATLERADLRLLLQCASYHLRLAIAIAMLAPKLRLANILALTWRESFREDFAYIVVGDHKMKRRTKRPLVAYVPTQLREILRAARRRRPKDAYVVTYQGRPVKQVTGAVRAAVERAHQAGATHLHYGRGREDGVTFHTLRHTAATFLAEMDVAPEKRQGVMGHADLSSTMHYTHLRPQHEAPAAEILSASLGDVQTLVMTARSRPMIGAGTSAGSLEAKTSKSARKLDIPQNDARRAIRRKS
jgi:integrase